MRLPLTEQPQTNYLSLSRRLLNTLDHVLREWAEGESVPLPLTGFSGDSLKYKGTGYDKNGILDELTKKALGDRLSRRRKKKHA
ncbi:MAG: hypothetical protein RIR18_2029 [Pseudomonadota bacterium]